GHCTEDPRPCDAPDPRLPDGWGTASVADRGRRGPRPPRVLLPGSGHDVPEETGPFRPGPPGRGARLPSAEGSVLRDGELRTLSLVHRVADGRRPSPLGMARSSQSARKAR